MMGYRALGRRVLGVIGGLIVGVSLAAPTIQAGKDFSKSLESKSSESLFVESEAQTRSPESSITQASERGSIHLLGKKIQVQLPNAPAFQKLLEVYPRIQKQIEAENPPIWRVKVLIFTRAEILEKGKDGIYRRRWNTLEPDQIQKVLEALAQFKVLVEAKSQGNLKIELDVSKDDAPLSWFLEKPKQILDEKFIKNTLAPIFNTTPFETDDRVYRGPYHSVFYVHPVLTESPKTSLVYNTPISSVAFYTDSYAQFTEGLLLNLYDKWIEHLSLVCRTKGYDLPVAKPFSTTTQVADPKSFMRPRMWSITASFEEPSSEEYEQRRWRPNTAKPCLWSEVSEDPWARLPKLETTFVPYQVYPDHLSSNCCVFVEAGDMDGFWDALPASVKPRVLGYAFHKDRIYVAVESEKYDFSEPLRQLSASAQQQLEYNSWCETARDPGFFSLQTDTDQEKGEVTKVTETGAYRHGYAELLNQDDLAQKFSDKKENLLSFWVKTKSTEPYALWFESRALAKRGWVLLGTPLPEPVEGCQTESPFSTVDILPNETWQKVTVDLDKAGLSLSSLSRISLTPHPLAKFYERQQGGQVELEFYGWSVGQPAELTRSSGEGSRLNESLETILALSKKEGPLEGSERKQLIELLNDPKEFVRLNALAVATHTKVPEAIPYLLEQAKSATSMIAEVACRALAYQDADEAWEALKNITVSGLFDHNRQAAIKQLGNTRNPKYAASISTALTIKNWHGRHKAVKALGKFEGPEASFLLLAFLHEIEPTVRHAVIQRLNPSYDLVNRRLLWNAVNDPSERVRAESYAKLIASPIPEYRGEGYKGIRDESLTIRLGLLDHLKQNPSENHREALRLAIIDTSPLVRAATLRAFATLPKEVRFEEIENTLSDSDSRVQEALLELAEAKKLQLPEATLKLLKQSKSPVVRERVSRL